MRPYAVRPSAPARHSKADSPAAHPLIGGSPARPLALAALVAVAGAAALAGCRDASSSRSPAVERSTAAVPETGRLALDPCAVALAPGAAGPAPDPEVARLQDQARAGADPVPVLERLGWTYVEKARLTYDPGLYDVAEQTALCMESHRQGAPEALLLRGHVLHSLHRFKEGESVARELVAKRGEAFDWGLLGDVLMEQGKLEEAVPAYQRMVDLKPGLQAYSRSAHMRWLKGDLDGAIELMRMAAQAGSPRNHEAVAWAYTKLALYELQAGRERDAQVAADAALRLVPGYAAALLARAQIIFAADRAPEAVEPLREAAAENPLPEFQWALAEALRESGRADEAEHVERRLAERGAVEDPRTFALFLASRGRDPETAVRLAREELERRADVLTQDVLAWTLAAAGRPQEAREPMRRALAEGTRDARVFYHAGLIARMTGDEAGARRWLGQASHIRQMLLPSERERLAAELAALQRGAPSARAGSRAPAARLASAPSGRP